MDLEHETSPQFLEQLSSLPVGYSCAEYRGRRYGMTISRHQKGVTKLYAEELGGTNIISFNLYLPDHQQPALKPCEMSASKVIDFVLNATVTAVA